MGNNNNKSKNNTLFGNIKSDYIFQEIIKKINEKKVLNIIKYNKSIQKRLNKDINNYKFYFFKSEGFNIKFIGGNISEHYSYIFEKIKTEKKLISKINYKLENIISLTTNKNNILYLIDNNKDKNLKNKYKTHCFILEFNINDMKTFDYIQKYYYEKIKLPNTHNLVYLIGVNNNLKNLKGKNIIDDNSIKKFAESNKINLISFNKNFNINALLSKLEYSIIEAKEQKFKNYEDNIINGTIINKDSYKVVFLGCSGTGAKTSLINRIVSNTFADTEPTSGAICSFKTIIRRDGTRINLELWDTSGKENYRSLTKYFFKDADCIILGYSVIYKGSFEEIKNYWISEIKTICNPKLMYLIGCKTDLYEYQTVSPDEAYEFAQENNLRFFEISNKNNFGIEEFVEDLANQIIIQ